VEVGNSCFVVKVGSAVISYTVDGIQVYAINLIYLNIYIYQ